MASLPSVSRDVAAFDRLSAAERMRLLQDLWDEIASDPAGIPMTDAQRAELDARMRDHGANPDACVDWAEVKVRLRSR
jgi:putative addiction module component (TIGR02574 family)